MSEPKEQYFIAPKMGSIMPDNLAKLSKSWQASSKKEKKEKAKERKH